MRRSRITMKTLALSALLVAAAAVGACGGNEPTAKTPTKGGTAPVVGATVSNTAGQTIGISAGAGADSELTGDAKSSYDKGFQLWGAGDLAGARAAVLDSASKAPKAGAPRESLGCLF